MIALQSRHFRAVATVLAAMFALSVVNAPHLVRAGTLPDITGMWFANGDSSKRCFINQSGNSVTLTNEQGRSARGTFSTPSTLDTDWGPFAGGHVTGNIGPRRMRINWSNGTYWVRAQGLNPAPEPATPRPTPPPTPAPERLNVSVRVANNDESPIHVYAASLRNGSGRSYAQCVSFRNVSMKVATDVDFSFVVSSYSGTVEADFGHEDFGTFTPPVNIDDHCWSGPLWHDRVVRLMSSEVVRVKRVTFKDGTTWSAGMTWERGYSNGGTLLVNPMMVPEATPPAP